MTDLLDVWVGDKRVGELIRENYEYSFQYAEPGRLDPGRDLVSLTMPVRAKRYDTQVLMPPFQMALPEGALLENLRIRFGKLLDVTNDMVLLKLVGNNTIGRVRFAEPGQPPRAVLVTDETLDQLLHHPETEDLFRELFDQLAAQSGISGVQPKVLWSEQGAKAALLTRDFILKSAGPDYPLLALNEYFCLTAAREAGLVTPGFHLAEAGQLLAVERFDIDSKGRRLAFEEACALLGRPNSGKYAASYEELADVIREVPCEPVIDAMRDVFKAVALSMLLGNGDAHLKNFGILYDDVTRKWLAPIYDLVCTTVYLPNDVPALTLAGQKAWPDVDTLRRFGLNACQLRKQEVSLCLEEVGHGLEAMMKLLTATDGYSEQERRLREHLLATASAATRR